MKSFQTRNPIPVAIIGIVVILVGLLAAYNTDRLPIIGRGTIYQAEFTNAAGIRKGNPVKIAGVVVGRVRGVELEGRTVEVSFDIKDAWIGDASKASVQLNTLLGQRFIAIDPAGDDDLDPDDPIPLARTTTPYEIIPAINKLSQTVGDIDTDRLAQSLDTLADTFSGTPGQVNGALTGLSRISRTIADRDTELRQLLARANAVTTTVAQRDAQIETLIKDLDPLLAELQRRRDAVNALLVGAQDLSRELRGLVADNRATLKPTLTRLASVAEVLERNQENLDAGIGAIGPYVHLFTNAVGNGRWFDAYVCGLIPPPLGAINEKGCQTS